MIRGAMIIEEGESVEQLDDDDGPNLPNGLSVLHFPSWLATHNQEPMPSGFIIDISRTVGGPF